MKSASYSLGALLALAFLGSFLALWKLPNQRDPFTYHDLSRKFAKVFSFEDDLRDAREEQREENENLFASR